MYTIHVDKTLQLFIEIFHNVGIWQSDSESYSRKAVKKSFFVICSAFLPLFFATNIFLCHSWNDSIFSAQAFIQTAVIYVKLQYLLFKKQEILAFLFDSSVSYQSGNVNVCEHANGKLKKLTKFIRPYFLTISITAVSVIIINLPILSAKRRLPFFISYTWNDSEIGYWSIYLLVSLSMLVLMIGNLITTLIWYIMLKYSIEYELLGHNIRNLGADGKISDKRVENRKDGELAQKCYFANLIDLINAHQNLSK